MKTITCDKCGAAQQTNAAAFTHIEIKGISGSSVLLDFCPTCLPAFNTMIASIKPSTPAKT